MDFDPQHLPQDNTWIALLPELSLATKQNDDWQAFQHLASRQAFKEAMKERVREVIRLLDKLKMSSCPIEPSCRLCEEHSNYEDHMGGPKHWKALHPKLPNGVPVNVLQESHWNCWPIRDGFLRFNELTGVLQMSRGKIQPGAHFMQTGLSMDSARDVAQDFVWEDVSPPLSCSSKTDGDWRSYSHLQSKQMFKTHMGKRAQEFEAMLQPFGAPPRCSVCGNHQEFSKHIPGPSHFKNLTDNYIKDGASVREVRESLWEIFELRDRILRFNVLDGAIQQGRSVPVIPPVLPVEPQAVPRQVEPPMVPAVDETFATVLPWHNGVFPAWGDRRREEDTISMSNISMVAHPGRWSAMGEESTDGASHSYGSKAGWALWWCASKATRIRLQEIHRHIAHSNEQLRCEGCGQIVTFDTLAEHLRSYGHFSRLMEKSLVVGNSPESPEEFKLKPVEQRLQTKTGELLLDHSSLSILADL